MAIQLSHRSQQQQEASPTAFGVGVSTATGHQGVQQALGAVGQLAGSIYRKEKALQEKEVGESIENWRAERSTLVNQMAAAEEQADWDKVAELYRLYESHNPDSEEFDLVNYQAVQAKRKLSKKDWQDFRNNLITEYSEQQIRVRSNKVQAEFKQAITSVRTGANELLNGFFQSGKAYEPGSITQVFDYINGNAESLIQSAGEKQAPLIGSALVQETLGKHLEGVVSHYKKRNDPDKARLVAEEIENIVRSASFLTPEVRTNFSELARNLVTASESNFDSTTWASSSMSRYLNGGARSQQTDTAAKLALYPNDKRIQQIANDEPILIDYTLRRAELFSKIGRFATPQAVDQVIAELDPSGSLSEDGKAALARDIQTKHAQVQQALEAGSLGFSAALAYVAPQTFQQLQEGGGAAAERGLPVAYIKLRELGIQNPENLWHPGVNELLASAAQGGKSSADMDAAYNAAVGAAGEERVIRILDNHYMDDGPMGVANLAFSVTTALGLGTVEEVSRQIANASPEERSAAGVFVDKLVEGRFSDDISRGVFGEVVDQYALVGSDKKGVLMAYAANLYLSERSLKPSLSDKDAADIINQRFKRDFHVTEMRNFADEPAIAVIPEKYIPTHDEYGNPLPEIVDGFGAGFTQALPGRIHRKQYERQMNDIFGYVLATAAKRGELNVEHLFAGMREEYWEGKDGTVSGWLKEKRDEFFKLNNPTKRIQWLVDQGIVVPVWHRKETGEKVFHLKWLSGKNPRYVRDTSDVPSDADFRELNAAPAFEVDADFVLRNARRERGFYNWKHEAFSYDILNPDYYAK